MTKLLANSALVLRIGGGICFIGHGVLALSGKTGFIGLLGTFGLDPIQALALLKVIGALDVLVGLLILFKPNKLVLQWAIAWTSLTIIAWGIHGDSLMDLARRATYMTTPLALLIMLYRRSGSFEQVDNARNEDLSKETALVNEDGEFDPTAILRQGQLAIDQLDLSMISFKLMDSHEGEGWTQEQCREVAMEYKRFLTLHLLYPGESIVPNLAIDTVWHYHILDTEAYYRDCKAIFGRLLHHYPYFGMKGKEDAGQFVSAFDRTKILYEKTFGSSMDSPDYLSSFQVRRSA